MLSDSEGEDVGQLTINEHFAKAFTYRKEREELQKRLLYPYFILQAMQY
jgi:protein KRI1